MKVVIVGGVAGGASAAARLRRLDEHAQIIIFERGEYVSFANCGLPYYIGGEIKEKDKLTLQTPASFKSRFNIDVRVKSEVVSINCENKTVEVKNTSDGEIYTESYDKLILSPGAEPVKPNIEGISSERVFTLRNIPDAERIKEFAFGENCRRAVVVGGGYIGVEMAENLTIAGLEVTVVEMSDHLIAPLDFDMAAEVHLYARQKGIRILLGSRVVALKNDGDGVTVKLSDGEISTDMVIIAVGVKPESALAKACGIATDSRGAILTDEFMRTDKEDVYAVGDAVQVKNFVGGDAAFIPLAGPANKQGRIAADNICGGTSKYEGTQGSAVLKLFDMTVATTGLNEKSASDKGLDYDKLYSYSASHATYYPGASNMSIKVLWDKKNLKIIGAQIVGFEGVDKRMDVIATAMRFGAKVTDLTKLELCYAPPFGSAKDPVNMVGYIAENVVSGKVKQFFWHDVESLPRDGSVTLLDVRTPIEVSRGKIEGFVNIPVDELRENVDKISKVKPVYVHCHSGLRSYIACSMLSGYGFDCYNLAGGWRFYNIVKNEKK